MKNGSCPKCGSAEIYVNRSESSHRNFMAIGWVRGVMVSEYICAECGFIESYLADMNKVSRIFDKCEKVSKQA